MTYSEKANHYIGISQGSKQHREIIDYYNSQIKPLPRGYKVKYTDSWCATFVSVILDMCGGSHIPYECSCAKMLDKCRKNKQIVTDGGAVDDLIFYDWNDDGTVNHVGIVSSITGTNYVVIEGNKNKKVGLRTINKDSKLIEAVARVTQDVKQPSTNMDLITALAHDVLRGKYGNGNVRKKALGKYYIAVQKKVNEIIKEKHG